MIVSYGILQGRPHTSFGNGNDLKILPFGFVCMLNFGICLQCFLDVVISMFAVLRLCRGCLNMIQLTEFQQKLLWNIPTSIAWINVSFEIYHAESGGHSLDFWKKELTLLEGCHHLGDFNFVRLALSTSISCIISNIFYKNTSLWCHLNSLLNVSALCLK